MKRNYSGYRYFRGEEHNPFMPSLSPEIYAEYEILKTNPRAWWWVAERLYDGNWDCLEMYLQCLIYKHMEYCPIIESDCVKSYYENAVYSVPINEEWLNPKLLK